MNKDKPASVLRVRATPENIRKSYAAISRFYGFIEDIFEKGLREKGLELLAVKEGETVLEVGSGTGVALQEIGSLAGTPGRVYGLDITPEMLHLTEKRLRRARLTDRVQLDRGDAREMRYSDNIFDAVYISATLELFDTPDIPVVLAEIKRVLKPQGRLVAASMSKEGRENFWFVRLYEWLHRKLPKYASCRPLYLEQAVRDAGFNILKSEEYLIIKLVPMKLVLATAR